ncbi:MAG: ATP-binding protein [Chloroflexota bacterium]|jgi:NAD-dependent dihydropyrimidine dehydrogenase PreA subunit
MYIVNIDESTCNGDGDCVDTCPAAVLELQDGKAVVVNPDDCLGCESCVSVCPTGSITITEM